MERCWQRQCHDLFLRDKYLISQKISTRSFVLRWWDDRIRALAVTSRLFMVGWGRLLAAAFSTCTDNQLSFSISCFSSLFLLSNDDILPNTYYLYTSCSIAVVTPRNLLGEWGCGVLRRPQTRRQSPVWYTPVCQQ